MWAGAVPNEHANSTNSKIALVTIVIPTILLKGKPYILQNQPD
jgi:hypothetical protein